MQGQTTDHRSSEDILTAELTAINQYYVHAKMCKNQGYAKPAKQNREESIEEMKHADQWIERILYFEDMPNMQRLNPIKVGESVPEQLQLDLEKEAVSRLNLAIEAGVNLADNGTRAILENILQQEKESFDWKETQLSIIDEIGKDKYLAEQIVE